MKRSLLLAAVLTAAGALWARHSFLGAARSSGEDAAGPVVISLLDPASIPAEERRLSAPVGSAAPMAPDKAKAPETAASAAGRPVPSRSSPFVEFHPEGDGRVEAKGAIPDDPRPR